MVKRLKYLNALRAFEAAARLGTFTHAAKELGVTPAAVGQHVRFLEEYVGKKLFHRSSSGLSATAATMPALAELRSGFDRLQAGFSILDSLTVGNQISLTVAPAFAWKWLAPRMQRLYERFPEVDLRIDTSPRLADIAGGEFDMSIRYGAPERGNLASINLLNDYTLPVCIPTLSQFENTHSTKEKLLDMPLLHIEGETSEGDVVGWRGWAQRHGLRDPRLDVGVRYPQSAMALQAAYAGQGVTLSGLILVIDDLVAGRLVAPLGPASALKAPFAYRIVTSRARRPSPVQEAFIRWVKDEARTTRDAMADFLSNKDLLGQFVSNS